MPKIYSYIHGIMTLQKITDRLNNIDFTDELENSDSLACVFSSLKIFRQIYF